MMSAAVGSQINIKECNLGASIGLGWFWFDCKQIFAFSKIFWEKWILDENQVNLLIFQWPALIYLAWYQFFFFQMMENFQPYPKLYFFNFFLQMLNNVQPNSIWSGIQPSLQIFWVDCKPHTISSKYTCFCQNHFKPKGKEIMFLMVEFISSTLYFQQC